MVLVFWKQEAECGAGSETSQVAVDVLGLLEPMALKEHRP